jgi:DNA helicase HerA-like ATPase
MEVMERMKVGMDRLEEEFDGRQLGRILALAEETEAVRDPRVGRRIALLQRVWDQELADLLEAKLSRLKLAQEERPFSITDADVEREFPYRERDSYFLGRSYGKPVFISSEELKENVLVHGKIGIGKTTFITPLIQQAKDHGVDVCVFDFKGEYGFLEDYGFRTLAPGDYQLNPLGYLEDRELNAQLFAKMFADVNAFQFGSYRVIRHLAFLANRIYGKERPTLADLLEILREKRVQSSFKGTQQEFRDRVEATLSAFVEDSEQEAELFNVSRGVEAEDLVGKHYVFRLDELSDPVASLVAQTIMSMRFERQRAKARLAAAKSVPNLPLEALNVFDEYERLFPRKIESRLEQEEPFMNRLVEFGRSVGIGNIIAGHRPDAITSAVKASPTVIVHMLLVDASDINEVSNAMGYSEREKRHTYRLAKGEAIVKVGGKRPVKLTEIPWLGPGSALVPVPARSQSP